MDIFARRAALIILAGLALRSGLAAWLPLTVDGNYAIAATREFSLSFLDHPPLGFWLPGLSADLFGAESPFVFRLPFLLMGSATGWLIYLIGRELAGTRAGYWSALLYTLSPFFTLFAGTFVLPDGPLNMFVALAALLFMRSFNRSDRALGLWAAAGTAIALALASKYQAILFPVAVLVFALWNPHARKSLSRPGPYLAAAIGLLGLVPTIAWNIENDWVSFAFHSGRIGQELQTGGFLINLAGQALYLLPSTLVLATRALWSVRAADTDWRGGMVALAALGPIVLFNVVYLLAVRSLPHWTMPGWLLALPLAAWWIVQTDRRAIASAKSLTVFAVPIWLLVLALAVHTRTGWITQTLFDEPQTWDNTSEIFDWAALQPALEERNLLDGIDFLGVTNWIDGGRFSTALDGTLPVVVLEGDPHHFGFMPDADAKGIGLVLIAGRISEPDQRASTLARLQSRFGDAIELADTIELNRGSRPNMAVSVMLLTRE